MKRITLLLCVILLLVVSILKAPTPMTASVDAPPTTLPQIATLPLYDSYYDCITSDIEQQLYMKIGEAIERIHNGDDSFIETGLNLKGKQAMIKKISRYWLYDHPEYSSLWYKPALTVQNDTAIRIIFCDNKEEPLSDSFYEILSASLQKKTDVQTALNAFLFLTENYSYDSAIAYTHSHDDWGLITNKTGCCQAFAFAYKRILDAAGIPNVVATTYVTTGGYHMVNCVKLSGHWVVINLTAALVEQTKEERISHFAVGQKEFDFLFENPSYLPMTEPDHMEMKLIESPDTLWEALQ